jgi:malonyl-CoA O-methyltransferase
MQNSIDKSYEVDASKVRYAFNGAAKNYDANALLQKTVANRLIESFEHIKITPSFILDLGSGTGYGAQLLKQQFKKAHVYQADLSTEMLKGSRKKSSRLFSKNHFLCAHAERIPLPNNCVDLVFSSLMLQWCNDPDAVFAEIRRVLKANGVFVFTTFGPGTLKELRECWRQVDDEIHVNAFTDMHDIGDALIRSSLEAPVLSIEDIVVTYDECKQLMRELKNIGAHNVNLGRRKTLTGKKRLQKVINYYETFRHNSKLPASYEVIYGHAWKPAIDKHNSNVQSISLDDLKQDLEKRKVK